MPSTFLTDGGTNYTSDLIKYLCKHLGIKKLQTTPQHCMGNGICERANRTIQQVLAMHVNTAQDNWDEVLPFALMSIRVSVSEGVGESPYFLQFGRDPSLPIDLSFQQGIDSDPEKCKKLREQIPNLVKTLHFAWDNAKKFAQKSHEKGKSYYDSRSQDSTFKLGDRVRLKVEDFKNKSKKLTATWHGPYRIVSITEFNADIVPVNNPRKPPKTIHINRIKHDYSSDLPILPSLEDSELFENDDFQESKTSHSNLESQSHFAGQNSSQNSTTEPLSNEPKFITPNSLQNIVSEAANSNQEATALSNKKERLNIPKRRPKKRFVQSNFSVDTSVDSGAEQTTQIVDKSVGTGSEATHLEKSKTPHTQGVSNSTLTQTSSEHSFPKSILKSVRSTKPLTPSRNVTFETSPSGVKKQEASTRSLPAVHLEPRFKNAVHDFVQLLRPNPSNRHGMSTRLKAKHNHAATQPPHHN